MAYLFFPVILFYQVLFYVFSFWVYSLRSNHSVFMCCQCWMFPRVETWQRYSFVVKVVVKIVVNTVVNRYFFLLTPLKKLSQKCFFTMLFNYLCEIDKYTLLLLLVLVFFFVEPFMCSRLYISRHCEWCCTVSRFQLETETIRLLGDW